MVNLHCEFFLIFYSYINKCIFLKNGINSVLIIFVKLLENGVFDSVDEFDFKY